MFIKSLINLHRYRKFDYRPRYYDETREKFNEIRVQKGMKEYSGDGNTSGKRISFKKRYDSQKFGNNSSNFRIALIFVVLCLAAYFILNY
jgi:hypothetical protein